MIKVLLVLIWPAGLAALACAAALLSRSKVAAGRLALNSPTPPWRFHSTSRGRASWGERSWRTALLDLAAVLALGTALIFGVMALLSVLVLHQGPTIDRPIYSWTIAHRVHAWAWVMKRLTKIGDTWTTWGAAATAAVCMAVARRERKWVPPLVLGAVLVVDHFLTLGIRETFPRHGPPDSPGGAFPSGGCDRVLVFYGTIIYLLWRDYSGRARPAIWAAAAVGALALNEAYSRAYLTLHWFTDVLSGLLYGALLLGMFITAIRLIDHPAQEPSIQRADHTLPAPWADSPTMSQG